MIHPCLSGPSKTKWRFSRDGCSPSCRNSGKAAASVFGAGSLTLRAYATRNIPTRETSGLYWTILANAIAVNITADKRK